MPIRRCGIYMVRMYGEGHINTRGHRGTPMTTIHLQHVGDKALLPRREFERLVELARQHDEIVVQMHEDDTPTLGIMSLAEQGGGFDFWSEVGEDIYSEEDREPA